MRHVCPRSFAPLLRRPFFRYVERPHGVVVLPNVRNLEIGKDRDVAYGGFRCNIQQVLALGTHCRSLIQRNLTAMATPL
jgi:hypothetical protein